MNHQKIKTSTLDDFKSNWKLLVFSDLIYKAIAFAVLAPLTGIVFRALLSLSGGKVIADTDILYFLLGPAGWIFLVVVGAFILTILLLELATLLGVLARSKRNSKTDIADVISFTISHLRPVLRLSLRVVGISILVVGPFLAIVGIVYLSLLRDFDINYYLTERPPEFRTALILAGISIIIPVCILLRLTAGWLFALPMVIFEKVPPKKALKKSSVRARGHIVPILLWIAGWLITSLLIGFIINLTTNLLGRVIIPGVDDSLTHIVIVLGIVILVGGLASLLVNTIAQSLLACLIMNLYKQVSGKKQLRGIKREAKTSHHNLRRYITNGRLAAVGVIAIAVAVTLGLSAVQTLDFNHTVQVTAHRGASAKAPENTMASIRQAIEDDADWVEIDVQESAEGEVIVIHDSDFMKLSGNPIKAWEVTSRDLEHLDIGSYYDAKFKDERVPTLADVLQACKGKANVTIELKYYGHDVMLEEKVARIVEENGMEENIVVMSLKQSGIDKMKQLRPNWTTGLLTATAIGDLTSANADFLAVNSKLATRKFVKRAHAEGKAVHAWTVNDPITMSILAGRGVDNLITDNPELAKRTLEDWYEMTPAEKLILQFAGLFGQKAVSVEQ